MNISVIDGSGDILEFLLPVVILVECRVMAFILTC